MNLIKKKIKKLIIFAYTIFFLLNSTFLKFKLSKSKINIFLFEFIDSISKFF